MMRIVVKNTLKQEYKQKLESRISRYIKIPPQEIMPNTHFAAPVAECFSQFRDGYFYGCISLTQSISESLIKFLCLKNLWKPDKVFEKNVKKLSERNFISDEVRKQFLDIWRDRDNYHHLNPNILIKNNELEMLAMKKIQLLQKTLKNIFGYSIVDGKVSPKNKKYWNAKDEKLNVFLNFP